MQLLWMVVLQSHGLGKVLLERGNAGSGIVDIFGRTGLSWVAENWQSHIPRGPPTRGTCGRLLLRHYAFNPLVSFICLLSVYIYYHFPSFHTFILFSVLSRCPPPPLYIHIYLALSAYNIFSLSPLQTLFLIFPYFFHQVIAQNVLY